MKESTNSSSINNQPKEIQCITIDSEVEDDEIYHINSKKMKIY